VGDQESAVSQLLHAWGRVPAAKKQYGARDAKKAMNVYAKLQRRPTRTIAAPPLRLVVQFVSYGADVSR
jgi:hypothetical protein